MDVSSKLYQVAATVSSLEDAGIRVYRVSVAGGPLEMGVSPRAEIEIPFEDWKKARAWGDPDEIGSAQQGVVLWFDFEDHSRIKTYAPVKPPKARPHPLDSER